MHRWGLPGYTCATQMSHSRLTTLLLVVSMAAGVSAAAPQRNRAERPQVVPAVTSSPVLLEVMQQELGRAMQSLAHQDPPPYFISYAVTDRRSLSINASQG